MMMRAKYRILITILILCNFVLQGSIPYREINLISSGNGGINSDLASPLFLADPVTFDNVQENLQTETESDNKKAINDFISTVADGSGGIIRGIYAENNFALQIIQQPPGQSGFVSTIEGEVTQFSMATKFGVTGLLAHNYLSGRHFFKLGKGDVIQLVYGDGNLKDYQISEIQRYQALQPKSPYSQFVNLITGTQISASQLFKRIYTGKHHLTLQTCIQVGEENSWGRLFIIANPI